MWNCIVYGNSNVNWVGGYLDRISFTNCCTTPTTTVWAAGNTTNDPIFMDSGGGAGTNFIPGNYRLGARSPCVNAGTNYAWHTNTVDVRSKDLDGRPRLRYGTVDMGPYEKIYDGAIFRLH